MLVIEGPDNVGKTVFAKAIVKYVVEHDCHSVMYQHMTRQNGSFNFFEDYKPLINPYAVQDRFHLGGLAYHEGVINVSQLRIIEGWIYGNGGLIILLHASDHRWYEERIHLDNRGNILDLPVMVEANFRYHNMIEKGGPRIDVRWDVSGEHFPDEAFVESVAEQWIERRREIL